MQGNRFVYTASAIEQSLHMDILYYYIYTLFCPNYNYVITPLKHLEDLCVGIP